MKVKEEDRIHIGYSKHKITYSKVFATERCCSLANTVFDSSIVLDYDLFVLQGHGQQPATYRHLNFLLYP